MTEGDITSIYKDDKGQIDANKYISLGDIKFFCDDINYIKNYAGYMGFAYPNSNYENLNFLKELKKNNSLITNIIWSVQFPDIDEDTCKKGNIII